MSFPRRDEATFAFTDVCIFTGDYFIEQGYVVVSAGLIIEVGTGKYEFASGIETISKPGHTLLPGLIDSHIHALNGNILAIEQPLRFGITTVCDMHNEAIHIAELKKLAALDKRRFSDLKCAGSGAIIPWGWPGPIYKLHADIPETKATIDSWPNLQHASEAEPFVAQQVSQSGAEYIKLFHELGDSLNLPIPLPKPSLALQKAVVNAAHTHNLIAVGHAFSYQGTLDLLASGINGLTHIFFDEPMNEEYLTLCKNNNVHFNPTLTTAASQTREGDVLQRAFAADPLAQSALFDTKPRHNLGMGAQKLSVENAYSTTRKLYQAGVPLLVGSDSSGQDRGTAYGLGVHMEIHALVHKCGVSVIDALRGVTSLIADRFGFGDRGRVGMGRKADLVLVGGDVRVVVGEVGRLCLPVCGVWRDGELAGFFENSV